MKITETQIVYGVGLICIGGAVAGWIGASMGFGFAALCILLAQFI